MKKLIFIFLSLLFFIPLLGGCIKSYDLPLQTVATALEGTEKLQKMKPGDNKALKRFYGLNNNDFEEVILYTPSHYMDVSEVLMIRAKNPEQLDLIDKAVDARVLNQIESFSGYGPEQVALLENYELKILGNTVFYAVSPDAASLKDAFIKAMQTK